MVFLSGSQRIIQITKKITRAIKAVGAELENNTSTLFAAMQIYKKSSPEIRVSPTRFFETESKAMEDIKRCAELEQGLINGLNNAKAP